MESHEVKQRVLDRFWERVKKTDGCWLWVGYLNIRGKGVVYLNGKSIYASRFSYLIHKGEFPKKLYVCHTCDNPKCVRPDHLFLGTQVDNMLDMKLKGRANKPKGTLNGRAKLDERSVRFIRRNYRKRHPRFGLKPLANRYGVCTLTIREVVDRHKWKHVE